MKEIIVHSPKHGQKEILLDDEDYMLLHHYTWFVAKNRHTFYAVRCLYKNKTGRKNISMHREILKLTDGKILVDHIDRNGLNNQRSNLRIATHSQNMANRRKSHNGVSKYIGVSWNTTNNKWAANICKDYKNYHLGLFNSERDAAIEYNKKAIELHGEFASINNI